MSARDLTDQQRAEIAALKRAGMTSAAIGVLYKISSDSARRIAKQEIAKRDEALV